MATGTKNARVIVAPGTINAAAATTNGTAINLTTALGLLITAKVTNGSIGPTVGCSTLIEVSADNANWKVYRKYTAPVIANAVTEYAEELPASVMYARVTFTGNTGQGVTVESIGHELSSVG